MVTQRCIAEKLGVSRRLVTYALNGNGRMSDELRQKICEEAEQLGYSPNRAAQALVTGHTHQIALCFPYFLGSSFYTAIIREFEILARHTPYDLLMTTIDPMSPKGDDIRFSSDGMIYVGSAAGLPRNIVQPAVAIQHQALVAPTERAKGFDRVQINLEHASLAAVRHLVEQGFRRVAYVAPEIMIDHREWRYHAYQAVMQEAGLEVEIISPLTGNEEMIFQQSYQILKEYFSVNGFPDALFCCNDDIAMGAYRALGELGRHIPEQTAVIGFDDLLHANYYLNPPLSSVHMPIEAACRRAWEMLMQRIENKLLPPQFEAIEAHLVVRESSSKSKTLIDKES